MDIPLIAESDLQSIWQWNSTVPKANGGFAHDLIHKQAVARPNAPAVCACDGELSYKQLDELSTGLAGRLLQLGVTGSGGLIPLCFEKSLWTSVAMLAVLKTGAAFVLLDSSLPHQRLQSIAQQVDSNLILSSTSNMDLSASLCKTVVQVSADTADFTDTIELPRPLSGPESTTMFAVFTSGSTGTPKGVLLTHANFSCALEHQSEALGLTNTSRVFDFASYAFDMAVHNAFAAFITGGCLCVPSEHDRKSNTAAVMRTMRTTVADLTPSVARLLDPESLPDLKTLIIGGEALSVDDVNRWWGKVRIVNIYGPAETHITTVNADAPTPEKSTLLGKGSGLVTWVVDPQNRNRLMPVGSVGELVLEGQLVGQGYLNDPERTAASFIEDPAWLVQGAPGYSGRRGRLYLSGDLVRYEDDGSLVYVTRKDVQVKIRGQRVELGEVEHRVQECIPEVSQVIAEVIKPQGENSSPMLAVFLQTGNKAGRIEESTTAEIFSITEDIWHRLSERLPRYMVPAIFFSIQRLPKTPSGKTNRIQLRQIGGSFSVQQLAEMRTGRRDQKRQPTSEREKKLQWIISQVLNVDAGAIGLDDNFFQLGGDSIGAMKLVAEARKARLYLSVADVFRYPTLSRMVRQCSDEAADRASANIPPFGLLGNGLDMEAFLKDAASQCQLTSPTVIRDAYPCTPLQEGLFSLSMKRPGAYTLQATLKLAPSIDIKAFRNAWEQVLHSLPVLRTRIIEHHELGLLQVVVDDEVCWVEASCLDSYLLADRQQPLDIGSPLGRYALVNDISDGQKWFVWTIHHALYDGWSEPLIIKAVNQAYQGVDFHKGTPFPAFIKHIQDKDTSAMIDYWKQSLDGNQAVPFPSIPPTIGEPVADKSVEESLPRPLNQTRDVTSSTIIRAAWALVAGRVSGEDDVIFGVTISGRNAPITGIETIVGPTFATLPLRVNLSAGQSVVDYLSAVQRQSVEMIPFEQIGLHNIAKISPDTRGACAFQTLLVIQPQDSEAENVLGDWQDGNQSQWFNSYGLTLVVNISSTDIVVQATFDSRVIEPWAVRKLLQQLAHVMHQLDDNASTGRSVRDITTVTPQDLEQLWAWNKTVPSPADRCVHELIQDRVREQPHAPAVSAWDGELTYQELDHLSTNMAGRLVELGVKAGDFVPLCFEKSMWATVAMLAMVKTAAAFVLLDPSLPQQRLQSIIKQVDAKLIVSSPLNQALSSQLCHNVVVMSPGFITEIRNRATNPLPSPSLDSVIYVVFTSGSTGTPKGAVIHHRSSASAVLHQVEGFGYTKETRLYDFSTYSFDGSILNAFTVLVAGGCLCVPTDDGRKSALAESMESLKANAVFLTPSVAELLSPEQVPHMRSMILGGEAIRVKNIQPWWDSEVCKVFTIYGPSECTPVSMINPNPATPEKALRLGWGAGQVTWIVDPEDHNSLVPIGSVGELLLEGPLVGQGYLDEPDKTAAAFIRDPAWLLKGVPGRHLGRHGRLYKTGDLAQFNNDGSISYISRKDDQVKIRGQRIELGEVEHYAQLCFPVATQIVAEVIMPQGKNTARTLAVFLQLGEEEMTGVHIEGSLESIIVMRAPEDAVDKLSQSLPGYMVPTAFFAMRQLPMGTTGKMDRKRLRELGSSFSMENLARVRTATAGPKRQPASDVERQMQSIWARVLGITPSMIGLDDSFFRLGGDSITAMKLVGEARRAGLRLAVADVFRHTRLQELALASTSSDVVDSIIPRARSELPVEQSFAQARLWFLEQLYPGLTWYLMPCIMRLRGPLNLEALNAAFLALERRHETLRTTFSTQDGVNLQHVRPPRSRNVAVVDKSSADPAHLEQILHMDETTPFNLSSEPGWRVKVYRIGKDEHILSILMHHIISDGWSIDLLRKELASFYASALAGQDPLSIADPLPVQYRDFSVWQREKSQVDEHERQLDHWLTELRASQPAELLCDKPRPATLSGKAGVRQLRIEGPLYIRLQEFCKARGVTPYIVLLAAFKATHYRLTGEGDGLIGSPNANRHRWEIKDTIGFFVNMQCLRVKVDDEAATFDDVVKHAQAATISSLANQDVPFERLVSKLRKERDLSRHPLIQLVFAVHSQLELGQFSLEGCDTEYIDQSITTRFDVEFHLFPEEGALRGELIFSTDLFEPSTMDTLLSVFHAITDHGIADPATPVALLPLLADSRSSMGLDTQLQARTSAYPRDSSIVDVFRQQAAMCPSKIAVKDPSSHMSYAELDSLSDNVALWLIGQSLAPETLIGVFSSRSCETIVAILGILKANLAYLPFDLKIPGARMESILSSIDGRKLVLAGSDVQRPSLKGSHVEFVSIAAAIDGGASDSHGAGALEASRPSPTSLAYVMFTSGSTGRPKGVMVEHRSIMRLARDQSMIEHDAAGTMAHMSNIAFDAATWEIYTTLLNGGTLVCIDHLVMLDPTAASRVIIQDKVRALFITPALLKEYLSKCPTAIGALDTIYIGGDRLDPQDMFEARGLMQGGKVINGYGPTENTTFSTFYRVPDGDECVNGVAIGQALTNSGAYVMDLRQRLVPAGVVGELVVTGDGLARGYLDPRQDAGRFMEVSLGGKKIRAYRTGDFVRYRSSDRQVEYLRRIDGQVKIRGQRVELGEIEHTLRGHASVDDAVVTMQRSDANDSHAQLTGFVTLRESDIRMQVERIERETDGDDEKEQVRVWEESFDTDIYAGFDDIQPDRIGRDFVGWTSMYDGGDINKGEMNEWLDDTIMTMLNGSSAGHVLELGSGSGMIVFNLINNGLESYVGLDPSQKAVEFVTRAANSLAAAASRVRMYKGTAADVGRLRMDRPLSPDLVVINSVAQYFPSLEYLSKVVEGILQLGARTIFFGDMRSYAMYREFHVTRSLYRVGKNPSREEVRRQMAEMEQMEVEFLVDPAFFTGLASRLPHLIEHVEILPKRMEATNELSCYRYAAVIHVKNETRGLEQPVHDVGQDQWIDFSEKQLNYQNLAQILQSSSSPTVAVSNIPYSKTIFERHILDMLHEDRGQDRDTDSGNWMSVAREKADQCPSLSATDLVGLAKSTGYRVEISWARQHSQRGGLDAVFHHHELPAGQRAMFRFPVEPQGRPSYTLSSQPLIQQVKRKVREQLQERLQAHLPSYMIPRAVHVLDTMPVNENGKVDRRSLAETVKSRVPSRTSGQQPTTKTEKELQALWVQVLNVEPAVVGLDDSFFSVGGDSLAAMRLVGEAHKIGLKLAVVDIFRHPTLRGMAIRVASTSITVTKNIPKTELEGPVDQSFAQGRLWFLEQLYPGLTWYLVPSAIRLWGPLRLDALQAAILALERRHDTLRTTFASRDDRDVQQVLPFQEKELNIIDVADEESLARALDKVQKTPFDLRSQPGWRVTVFRLDDENHLLSIIMHHIISDGWSVDILRKELSIFYAAAVKDQSQDPLSQVEPLPIQYRDFSVWQKDQEQIEEHQRQLTYWAKQLETSQPAELLYDKPRPSTLSGGAATESLRIEGSLYKKLQSFCSMHGVTPFITLLSTFRATHFFLTGSADATMGTVNANRDRWEVKDMIGFFVNMQCIRIKVEDESFEQLVRQVYATTMESFANQDVPFEKIVSQLQRDRDLSRHPLAQLVFAFHSQMDLGDFTLGNLKTETVQVPPTTRFDAEFHFFQEQQALQGEVLYSTDLFEPETIRNMLSVFHSVLEAGLTSPVTAIKSLPIFSDKDFTRLDNLGLIKADCVPYPRNSSIVDLFRQQASLYPGKVAVKDSTSQLTYAQLDHQSDMLARWLSRRAFVPETLVSVFSPRCCETIVAFLGILKANLAYLPFDVKIPQGRMDTILSSIEGHKIILVGPDVYPPAIQREDVEFVAIAEALQDRTFEDRALTGPSATSLAYVMFTSGSTGKPKGVMIDHRGLVRLVKGSNMASHLPVAPTMAHITNPAFDVSAWEIYGALLNGGTLICISAMMVLDFRVISDTFAREGMQTVIFTPALLKQYLSECPSAIAALDALYVAGDRADANDLFMARGLMNGPVVNAYGPTENSVISTLYSLQDGEKCVNGVPIGRTISNSGAYVMDKQQRLVPLGVIGELIVTGDGLARGYTDPERDVDRFVTIAIGERSVQAYRTGDYVRYRPTDGQMEFLGRIDGQVKVRGHRVELAEIELFLRSHGAVNDAVVVLQQEESREAQLAGFITIKDAALDGAEPDDDDAAEMVHVWGELFDADTYSAISDVRAEAIGRDFIGWVSMYNGKEIDKTEMNEWLDDTISTMLNGGEPRDVLELGTGSGMILFNLTKGLNSYTGLEPSAKAVDFTVKTARSIPSLRDNVQVYVGTAEKIDRLPGTISPNLVVVNSVAQYFPSQEYLLKVIEDAVRIESVETLFFGDIRSYPLSRQFQVSSAVYTSGETATKDEIRREMERISKADTELLVDPAFFTALAAKLPDRVDHVEILPKRMKATNELSSFRYAAVIHLKRPDSPRQEVHGVEEGEWIDFRSSQLDGESLSQLLGSSSDTAIVAVSNIPYRKTIIEQHILDALDHGAESHNWISTARRQADKCPSLSAVDLVEIGESQGFRVEVSWARQYSLRGGLDAVFHRLEPAQSQERTMFRFPSDHHNRPAHNFSSRPLQLQLNQKVQKDLYEKLQQQLPAYMIPQVITTLDKMPINTNGKVDRRALSVRVQSRTTARSSSIQQPRTDAEREMQRIWAHVLNIDASTIGVEDSFFHLGGSSISAMRVVSEARKAGLELSVADVFRYDVLEELTRQSLKIVGDAEEADKTEGFVLVDPLKKAALLEEIGSLDLDVRTGIEDILPLTSFQEKIILDGEKVGQHANYFYIDLGSDVKLSLMEESFRMMLDKFPILRSCFLRLQGQLWRVVFRQLSLPIHVKDVRDDLAQASDSFCFADVQTLSSDGIPISLTLLRHSTQGVRLVLRLSHAQYDGISFPIILQSLMDGYHGIQTPPGPEFTKLLIHAAQKRDKSIAYWTEVLRGSKLTVPEAVLYPEIIPGSSPERIYEQAEIAIPTLPGKTTAAALLSAAWALLLSRITGEADVVFGHVVAGRNTAMSGIAEMVGTCLNIIPLRASLAPNKTPRQLLLSLQEQFVSFGDADSLGFKDIIEHCTDWAAGSTFGSMVQHQNIDEHPEIESTETMARVQFFENHQLVPPSLFMVSYPQEGGRLQIKLFGNTHILTRRMAGLMVGGICRIVSNIGDDLDASLGGILEGVDLE
ncbi:NRPS [Amphichorda felina]